MASCQLPRSCDGGSFALPVLTETGRLQGTRRLTELVLLELIVGHVGELIGTKLRAERGVSAFSRTAAVQPRQLQLCLTCTLVCCAMKLSAYARLSAKT